ncbi:MAG: tetratricopeptide repeat protein [Polyangia bacterium]
MNPKHSIRPVVACLLLHLADASAQSQAAVPTCGSVPACRALFEQAQQHSGAGRLDEALSSYRQAYELQADPRLLFSIGRVLHKLGQSDGALSYYQQFVESPLDDEAQKSRAREYMAQLRVPPPQAREGLLNTDAKPKEERPTTSSTTLPEVNEQKRLVPVYKKAWFWAVVAGSAAAVGLGIGLGVGLSNRGPELPADINLYHATF